MKKLASIAILCVTLAGCSTINTNLGWMYHTGATWFTRQNYAIAAYFYQKAADEGDAIAQNNLGEMYLLGQGVQYDKHKGCDLLRKAADQEIRIDFIKYSAFCATETLRSPQNMPVQHKAPDVQIPEVSNKQGDVNTRMEGSWQQTEDLIQ